jgi:hypothetical protein
MEGNIFFGIKKNGPPIKGFYLVYRLLNPLGFVAFKMGRRQGARRAHI